MHNPFIRLFVRLPLLIRLLIFAIATVLFFGLIIHYIEPKQFPTVFDGVWWSIVTTSTIGYGDYVPKTLLGRLTTIILILVGASFVATYFANLASTFVLKQNALLKGKIKYMGESHIIIVGWNERAKLLIQYIHDSNRKEHIVLIDESLESNPCPHDFVHFIKGRAYLDDCLAKANATKAKLVIITADQSKMETQSDMFTILTILSLKGVSKDNYVVAEILTADQVENAIRAGANDIIQSNVLSSFQMIHSMIHHRNNSGFVSLLKSISSSTIHFIHINQNFLKKDLNEIAFILLQENKIVLGIYRDKSVFINPPKDYPLKDGDQLIVITNNPT